MRIVSTITKDGLDHMVVEDEGSYAYLCLTRSGSAARWRTSTAGPPWGLSLAGAPIQTDNPNGEETMPYAIMHKPSAIIISVGHTEVEAWDNAMTSPKAGLPLECEPITEELREYFYQHAGVPGVRPWIQTAAGPWDLIREV